MFGPALEVVRGKTTQRKPDLVKTKTVAIPKMVAERLNYGTLAADLFFVDRITFLLTL